MHKYLYKLFQRIEKECSFSESRIILITNPEKDMAKMANSLTKETKYQNFWYIKKIRREPAGRGLGGRGAHLSPWIHQEYSFRHRSACRPPAESQQEDLTSGKEHIEPRKTRKDEGTRGKHRNVSRTGPALGRWGNWSRGPIPTGGQLSESEEKHLRLRGKQLICGLLNGMRIRQALPQPYIYQAGTWVFWKGQQLGAGV